MGILVWIGIVGLLFAIGRALLPVVLERLSGAGGLGPRRITLKPMKDAFSNIQAVSRRRRDLRAGGYRDAGSYAVTEMPGLGLAVLIHPETHAIGVVYDHPTASVYCDLVLMLEGDRAITVSSAPSGGELDGMPGQIKRFLPGASVEQLIEALDLEAEPGRAVTAADFPREFQDAYAREMDWRASRGGATENEVRAIAQSSSLDVSDEDIESVMEDFAVEAADMVAESCLERFLADSVLSEPEQEKLREHALVIHARLDPEQAAEQFLSALRRSGVGHEELATLELDAQRETPLHHDPRALFASLNGRALHARLEKAGEVDQPVAADIYRLP